MNANMRGHRLQKGIPDSILHVTETTGSSAAEHVMRVHVAQLRNGSTRVRQDDDDDELQTYLPDVAYRPNIVEVPAVRVAMEILTDS